MCAPHAHSCHRAPRYDWVLKTRPDTYWAEPLGLATLAASMPAVDIVLTCNDLHVLLHRSALRALLSARSMQCDRRCALGSAYLRGFFHSFNEYCLLLSHIASCGLRQLEVSHPWERCATNNRRRQRSHAPARRHVPLALLVALYDRLCSRGGCLKPAPCNAPRPAALGFPLPPFSPLITLHAGCSQGAAYIRFGAAVDRRPPRTRPPAASRTLPTRSWHSRPPEPPDHL